MMIKNAQELGFMSGFEKEAGAYSPPPKSHNVSMLKGGVAGSALTLAAVLAAKKIMDAKKNRKNAA